MGRPCIIENCENVVSDRSRLDACETCRASINRWKKRSAAEVYDRRQKLTKYSARLEPLVDEDVHDIKSAKRRAQMQSKKKYQHITTTLIRETA